MPYPYSYDNIQNNAQTGGGSPASDNNNQAQAINSLQRIVGTRTDAPATPFFYSNFDGVTDGWTVTGTGSVAYDTLYKKNGLGSLKLTNGSSGQSSTIRTVPSPGTGTYCLRVSVAGNATSTGKFVTASISNGTGTYTQVSVPVKLTTTFQQVCAIVQGSGTTFDIKVNGVDLGASNLVWIDEVEVSQVFTPVTSVLGNQILKNGVPKRWRGINHTNVPIGSNYTSAWTSQLKQARFDLPDIAAAGFDAIRLYADAYDKQGYGAFLDEAYRNGIDVFIGYFTSWSTDYRPATGSANRTAQIAAYQAMITNTKYHPAIVSYAFGNEVNYNLGVTPVADFYSLLQEACVAGKVIDSTRFCTTSNGDLGNISTQNSVVTALDVWGANIYRGTSFGNLDLEIQQVTTKPFLIFEYGYDRYNHKLVVPGEDELGQATRELSLTRELDAMHTMSGRFLFEWADEWWKESGGGNTLTAHDANGLNFNYNDDRDQLYDEEWFGITEALPDQASQPRVKKLSYVYLKNYQTSTPMPSKIDIIEIVKGYVSSPMGFVMTDNYGVPYRIKMSGRGVMESTPFYILPPENLTVPILKFDAGTVVSSANLVSEWVDQSTSRRSAVQFNPGNQPTVVASVQNGLPVLRFSGAGKFLDIDNMVIGGAITVFAVAANKRTTSFNDSIDTIFSSAPSGGTIGGLALATFNFYGDPVNRSFSADFTGGGTPTLWVNGTTNLALTQGVFKVLTFQGTVTPHNFSRFGMYTNAALNGINDIAEFIVYQGTLNTTQRNAVENSLISKYAIT